jgi:hypothetical protein
METKDDTPPKWLVDRFAEYVRLHKKHYPDRDLGLDLYGTYKHAEQEAQAWRKKTLIVAAILAAQSLFILFGGK